MKLRYDESANRIVQVTATVGIYVEYGILNDKSEKRTTESSIKFIKLGREGGEFVRVFFLSANFTRLTQ